MFRKLFLSFWLTVAIVAVALEAASLYLRRLEQQSRVRSAALATSARSVTDAYERGVSAAFTGENILDAGGHSILGRPTTPAERNAATMAARIYASGFGDSFGSDGVVAVHFLATSGHPFSVIARARTTFIRSQWFALAALLVVGGIVCFVLARHFAAPLVQLGAAANAVADGRLDTRVGPRLTARRDEIGRLSRDFDRMAERIESLMAAERRTLGDASHELRSPLARLNVALSLARQHPQSAEHLARIEREAERLDKLIAELLALARIDSGVETKRERFDLMGVVQEIVADGDFEARASGRRVELVASDACTIDGAAELMRSAIENVVRNAIRHTAVGTAVEVALRCDSDRASLSVRDHGSGVDEASLAEIFKPFRRVDETSGGAGLGLAIAERVVRMHGGTIRAANAAG
ncbi:MAG TPA: ATP-binding protein, partial [Thermoanaerobaculia bacterium]|nr:ATP-binding protein [Thermoanaerobaculia bacterium]